MWFYFLCYHYCRRVCRKLVSTHISPTDAEAAFAETFSLWHLISSIWLFLIGLFSTSAARVPNLFARSAVIRFLQIVLSTFPLRLVWLERLEVKLPHIQKTFLSMWFTEQYFLSDYNHIKTVSTWFHVRLHSFLVFGIFGKLGWIYSDIFHWYWTSSRLYSNVCKLYDRYILLNTRTPLHV